MDRQHEFPHIGQILRKYVTERRIRQAAWGRKQGVSPRNVGKYLKRGDMQIHTLLSICHTLNYNFFKQVTDTLPPDMPPVPDNPLANENHALRLRVDELEKQMALVKELLVAKNR